MELLTFPVLMAALSVVGVLVLFFMRKGKSSPEQNQPFNNIVTTINVDLEKPKPSEPS